jgi:hypothetical protein
MSQGSSPPFYPVFTATIAANTTSQNALLGSNTIGFNGEAIMIYNNTTSTAFVAFGSDLTVVANSALPNAFPLPANSRTLLDSKAMNGTPVSVAVILSSGSGNVYVTRGQGTNY